MTRIFARFALGLGLSAALIGVISPAMAQTTPPAPAADAAPAPATAQDGISMGLPDGLPDQANAAEGQVYLAATFDAWEQRCVKQANGADPCQLYQLLKDQSGNPVSEISIFTLPAGGQAVFGASIMAPLETLLTANLRVAVDQNKAKFYPFSYCTQAGCVAKIGFTADELAMMKKGTAAVLNIVPAAAPDKVVTVSISLKGFSAAYQAVADAAAKAKP
ncbi:MAG: invasion associated locus B family protein [Cypionkella sp.]